MNSKGQYPTQPTYPVQPPGNPVYPQTLHLPQAPPYTDAPPAYSELYRPSFVHPGAATVPTMCQIWSWCHHWQHSSSTSWMPSQRCSACSHAGSQRPCNSTQGKLLHGWLRWWLHYLVRSCGHSCAGEDITYFSTSHNVTALVILT
ncbi:rCG50614, isoform CRA_a [Rattus norvegicus]|uniref:DAZ-associated protein 2 n=1 Tax=Rattus norvegicus TaxID=10116 RepID=A6KCK8_RAT|nr:rCG50614, isoform CRA_a [Rattus norvegicus]EDL86930.1 rCG50614, isoform CRA_a [Rattus norvegicus]